MSVQCETDNNSHDGHSAFYMTGVTVDITQDKLFGANFKNAVENI